MGKLPMIHCENCGVEFQPKSSNNRFCCRKCFKKNYLARIKEQEVTSFPEFGCSKCGQHIKLDFHPVKDPTRWLNYKCPGCNTLMIDVCEEIFTDDIPAT